MLFLKKGTREKTREKREKNIHTGRAGNKGFGNNL